MDVKDYALDPQKIPRHVAIIMDGNGRWAKQHNKRKLSGHRKGLETLMDILKVCEHIQLPILTVFAFSTENWRRSKREVDGLMRLFQYFFKREFDNLQKKNVKVLHSGILKGFDSTIVNIIHRLVEETKSNSGPILNLAINYSGHIEIVEATRRIAKAVDNQSLLPEEIDETLFSKYLFHPELPDPDLLIRTSGELRISNFLLWQLAYAELWFTETYWPDFTEDEFIRAIQAYQKRDRRFGGRNE